MKLTLADELSCHGAVVRPRFTIVEVTASNRSAVELWIALAKPKQALTLVLARAPEGSCAEVFAGAITDEHREISRQLNLKPGDVYRVTTK